MLRLSSVQVSRITEKILDLNPRPDLSFTKYEIEDLVEDILKEVLPLEPQIQREHRTSSRMPKAS